MDCIISASVSSRAFDPPTDIICVYVIVLVTDTVSQFGAAIWAGVTGVQELGF